MLPTFETERLILRPRMQAHFDACIAMDKDPLVVRYLNGPWAGDIKHRAFLTARMTANYPSGQGYWSIFAKENPNKFLGWILLIPLDAVGPEIETGWRLVRDTWGKGYATEAASPILRYGFETLGLDEIVADIHPENERSQRVAMKLGLRLIGPMEYQGGIIHRFALKRAGYAARTKTSRQD